MATGIKRDDTRALECVIGARNTNDPAARDRFLAEAQQILEAEDARTGRKDPTKRRRSTKAKRPAKKAARKSRRTSRR